jgi:hypothetical protein
MRRVAAARKTATSDERIERSVYMCASDAGGPAGTPDRAIV